MRPTTVCFITEDKDESSLRLTKCLSGKKVGALTFLNIIITYFNQTYPTITHKSSINVKYQFLFLF